MFLYNYNPLRAAAVLSMILTLSVQSLYAQTKIGGTAGPGNASAVLELESTTQGFLHPRMTTTQRDAISNPATGLTIYNTTTNCIQVYKGAGNGGWFDFCSGAGTLSFTNCSTPVITGALQIAQPASATVTLNYVNNTGQAFASFSSGVVSGLTLTAPGGTVTPVAGTSITLTVSGTPTSSGTINIPVVLAGAACDITLNVTGCSDPAATFGSTGCVVFTYRGQQTVLATVRARDGKIWLRQNLGSSQVATALTDAPSFGDLFQWGRWDDGHQLRTPLATWSTTAPSPNNPSGIASGNTSFYRLWWSAGTATDTWTNAAPGTTNGTDPCAALGSGWHMPTSAEWATVVSSANENITNLATAFASNLKMAASGFRDGSSTGTVSANDGSRGDYWSATTATGAQVNQFHLNASTVLSGTPTNRNQGHTVRCLK